MSENECGVGDREPGVPARGRRRKSRAERGLPDAQARLDLAQTYLDVQHARWPELAACGELPPLDDATAAALADEFRTRFLSDEPLPAVTPPAGAPLGGGYLRYSCDNSNPRSLAQQLRNALERAAADRVFVPWAYVFADAAVTGTTANRRGYRMAKEAIRLPGGPATLYVDELGRAARDLVETLRLGRLIERVRKRLIGATDGFDSTTPYAQMMLSIFGSLHELFVDQLRKKVDRGMRDAFRQGRNVRPPSFGYKLVPAFDPEGRPLLDRDGSPLKAKVIDAEEALWVEEAFRLYAERGWSPERIAKLFNERNVGGRRSWDRPVLIQLLTRATYVGVEYEGKTRRVKDPDTDEVVVEKRPKAEWQRRDVPHLRIVSDELFARAQARMKECSDAFAETAAKAKATRSRTAAYPKVLVRPFCRCGAELQKGRSGKNASFCCPDGSKGKNGCTLRTYKSVAIVVGAILAWVKENLFTDAFVEATAEAANAALAEEAAKPREDLRPIRREINALKAKCGRISLAIEDQPEADVTTLVARLRGHERKLKSLRRRLRAAKAADAPLPEPFTAEEVRRELGDVRGLLEDEVEAAAPVLADLLGPVVITEGDRRGRKETAWVASFSFAPAAVLARAAEANGRPSARVWRLAAGRPGAAVPVELVVGKAPEYERLAPRFKELRDGGATVASIAASCGRTRKFVAETLRFADTGERPRGKPRKRRNGDAEGKPNATKYKQIAAAVARLRDEEELPWRKILERLREAGDDVSEATARRAYDHARRDRIAGSVTPGRRTLGRSKRLGREVHAAVARLLDAGDTPVADIARQVGCSASTVHRVKKADRRPSDGTAA